MKVYKATDKDMKCRGFQYTLGKTAEVDGDIELCERGLHACEMPLDVLGYYVPGDGSRYFEAELDEVSNKKSDDTKRVGKKLTLSAEIGIPGLVKAQVEYVKAQCDFDNAIKKADAEKKNHATGDRGAASATGWRGAASATGWSGAASATGERGAAYATGDSGAASATGWSGAASATGERGAASATGWSGAAFATGSTSAAAATSDRGAASATGWSGAASATGKYCVAMTTGFFGRVMGDIGNAIVCVERRDNGEIAAILSGIVDGETLKPGVWYTVKNGQWVEVQK
nr:MAG TPA: hypothetical protein [Caudoviricetes sp.]